MDNQLPFPEAPAHELDRMISIASREVALRAKVYPRWIEAGRVRMSTKQYLIRVEARVLVEYVVESETPFTDPRQAFDDGEMVDQIDIETVDHDWNTAKLEVCE